MIEIFMLAFGLSMDAFAVAIGLGVKSRHNHKTVSLQVGSYFGFFQALMPLIGYMAGSWLMDYIQAYDHWIAFFLLFLIGAKMIYESFDDNITQDILNMSHRMLLTLAIATSIDAGAAGFTLGLIEFNPYFAMLIIGVVTFCMSYVGVYIGAMVGGEWLESKAEFLGGVVLIGIGAKILFWHINI